MKALVLKKIFKTLLIPVSWIINLFLSKLGIFIVYRGGSAIGNHLTMTTIVKLINLQYRFKCIVLTTYPQIFLNNPRVIKAFKINKFVRSILYFLNGKNIEQFSFPDDFIEYMQNSGSLAPLVQSESMHFKRKIDYSTNQCEIYFDISEKNKLNKKFPFETKEFYVINPHSKITYTPVKDWGFENFQLVVNQFPNLCWLQVGMSGDKLLDNVVDLRSQTNLRELSYIISKSRFVLSNEGLVNHIASSFKDVKSIVISSGFAPIEHFKYENTLTLSRNPQVDCAPCWLLDECPMDKKYCTEDILVNDVVERIKEELNNVHIEFS